MKELLDLISELQTIEEEVKQLSLENMTVDTLLPKIEVIANNILEKLDTTIQIQEYNEN
jgi:hypothetical protein